MPNRFMESQTAYKVGWGSARWRRVSGLLPEERLAVRAGDTVWFSFTPYHYTQSGYKIVTVSGYGFDSREPTRDELAAITKTYPNRKRRCDMATERDPGKGQVRVTPKNLHVVRDYIRRRFAEILAEKGGKLRPIDLLQVSSGVSDRFVLTEAATRKQLKNIINESEELHGFVRNQIRGAATLLGTKLSRNPMDNSPDPQQIQQLCIAKGCREQAILVGVDQLAPPRQQVALPACRDHIERWINRDAESFWWFPLGVDAAEPLTAPEIEEVLSHG